MNIVQSMIRYRVNKYAKSDSIRIIRSGYSQVLIRYKSSSIDLAKSEANLLMRDLSDMRVNPEIQYCNNFTIKITWEM